MTPPAGPEELARDALERVCSGSDPSAAIGVYSPDFRDHVNAEDQVSQGNRVASRWLAEGHNRGRPIRIWGIVISRIEDGEIVEDWAASDSLEVVRQLGPRRTLLLGMAWLRRGRRHVKQHPYSRSET